MNKIDAQMDKYITFFLVVIIIVLINAIAMQFTPTIDLTDGKIYSISKQSKITVKNLSEPMTVKVFYTPDMPSPYSTYIKYIRDILQEYKRAGGDNFRFEIIDVKLNPNAANEYDIQPVQMEVVEKDDIQLKRAYLGVAMIYGNAVEKIPFIQTTEGLEYTFTTLMSKMVSKVDRLLRLEDNIDVYLFLSSNIPLNGLEELPNMIEERVNILNKELMNKLTYRYIDSVSHSDAKEIAEKFNVPIVPWEDVKNQDGSVSVPRGEGYIGLVVSSGTNQRFMDILSYTGNVSEMLNDSIEGILNINKVIGYTTGHDEPLTFNPPEQFNINPNETMSSYADAINESYVLEGLNTQSEAIPENVEAILMINPNGEFTDYEIYEIDQFIMSGKPVGIFKSSFDILDNEEVRSGQMPPTIIQATNKIDALLKHYGIEISPYLVLDKNAYEIPFDPQTQAPPRDLYFVPIVENTISMEHPITKKINLLVFPFASEIKYIGDSNETRFTPIVTSSEESWTMKEGDILMIDAISIPPEEDMQKHTFAATLEGKLTSYFVDKEIPSAPSSTNQSLQAKFEIDEKKIGFIPETENGKLVVMSSSELAKNSFFLPNEVMLLNSIDWMLGNTDMLTIRRKGLIYNPPKYFSDFVRLSARVINIVILPILVVAFGLILYRHDLKRRKNIRKMFNTQKQNSDGDK